MPLHSLNRSTHAALMTARAARQDPGDTPELADREGGGRLAADREEDRLYLAVLFVVLAIFLSFSVLNIVEERRRSGHPIAIWEPITWEATSGVFFFAVAIPLMSLTRRFWPTRKPWGPKIAIQAAAAIGVSLIHVLAIGWLRWAVYRIARGYYDPLAPLGDWPYEARKGVFAYAAIVTFYVMWRELRRPRAAPADASPEVLEVRDGARAILCPSTTWSGSKRRATMWSSIAARAGFCIAPPFPKWNAAFAMRASSASTVRAWSGASPLRP